MGGRSAMEWPLGNSLWKEKAVETLKNQLGYVDVRVDGCRFGLTSREGIPMQKRWVIATNHPALIPTLGKVCDGTHDHQQIGGSETARSGNYPLKLAQQIYQRIFPTKGANAHVVTKHTDLSSDSGQQTKTEPTPKVSWKDPVVESVHEIRVESMVKCTKEHAQRVRAKAARKHGQAERLSDSESDGETTEQGSLPRMGNRTNGWRKRTRDSMCGHAFTPCPGAPSLHRPWLTPRKRLASARNV